MYTDSRFVDLVLIEVRLQTLREVQKFIAAQIQGYENEHHQLSEQITNTFEASRLNKI